MSLVIDMSRVSSAHLDECLKFITDLEGGVVQCELTCDGIRALVRGGFSLSKSHRYLWRYTPSPAALAIVELWACWLDGAPAVVIKRFEMTTEHVLKRAPAT